METIQQSEQNIKLMNWQCHISAWENSDISQKEYCRCHSLALSTFSYWKRKIRQSNDEQPRFYPLSIPTEPVVEVEQSGSKLHLLVSGDRFHIQIENDFSSSLLKQVVLTLEELQ